MVRVMEDDPRRPPPLFPGPRPAYLLNREELAKLWNSGQPAVFVTDVYRTNWESDPPMLPDGEKHQVPLPSSRGLRQAYTNKEAWERLQRQAR